MKQSDLLLGADPIRASDDDSECERDLFGNPTRPFGGRAPTYRPRAPKQQALTFDTFTLGSK